MLERSSRRIEHRVFRDLPELIEPGDVLVLNETKVFPARLVGRKPTGAPAEILLLRPHTTRLPDPAHPGPDPAPDPSPPSPSPSPSPSPGPAAEGRLWLALVRPGGKLKPGRTVDVADDLRVRIVDSMSSGERIVELDTPLGVAEAVRRYGRIPLPPYIGREPGDEDRDRYQTVYARVSGSVAAPTAGLHFTPSVLARVQARGATLARIILHVGVGTFRPVEGEDPSAHPMHAEWYSVSEEAAREIARARAAGGSVWAVGTTTVRTLESAADPDGRVRAGEGWTDLFIRPGYEFRVVDRLITNFHLPRSTLLMLVAAFGGYERVMRAYREAIDRGYRFYSYGDAMAIL